jgi:hypothetical protein
MTMTGLKPGILMLALTAWASCTKETIVPTPNIYIAGTVGSYPSWVATLWKNGQIVSLVVPVGFGSAAACLAVHGTDVYVGGRINNSTTQLLAAYWKNGTMTQLSDQASNINAMAISGTDIYAGGEFSGFAAYWKNGTLVQLNNTTQSMVNGMCINGTDVYASGYLYNAADTVRTPVYWKNGVMTILSGTGATALNITLSGTDLYIGGFSGGPPYSFGYWKNGTFESQPNASINSNVRLVGSHTYMAGANELGYAGYWKDGVLTQLASSTSYGTDIGVSGSDVYMSGVLYQSNNNYAVVWKNGEMITLSQFESLTCGLAIQ